MLLMTILVLTHSCFDLDIGNQGGLTENIRRIERHLQDLNARALLSNQRFVVILEGINQDELKTILEVHDSTIALVEHLEDLKIQLIYRTGGTYENEESVTEFERMEINLLMIKEGLADETKRRINNYAKFLAYKGYEAGPIIFDSGNSPVFKNDPKRNAFSFPVFYFGYSGLHEAMAFLSIFQGQIIALEKDFLLHHAWLHHASSPPGKTKLIQN